MVVRLEGRTDTHRCLRVNVDDAAIRLRLVIIALLVSCIILVAVEKDYHNTIEIHTVKKKNRAKCMCIKCPILKATG
ncbi:hypothetical protein DPMN_056329 [Dreissena polymorpha]|uniref:Uncharacterized protein n=1 Tax=Dreissena polymorpha TaxID=45954 RepID=A0A9D4HTE1_DREPO|nr:hypothetical protein DPMN_056329 [Dreissena polymorpha]